MLIAKRLLFVLVIILACTSFGKLEFLGDLPNSLKEVSANEFIPQSDLIWVIEDSGNENILFGLDENGDIEKSIKLINAYNEDWEDLTSDNHGNLYVGDFGNNDKKRDVYRIYKIHNKDLNKNSVKTKLIEFTLPFIDGRKDFEAFFQYNNIFYLLTKEYKELSLFTVPNTIGKHEAKFIQKFELEGKDTRVTSADISEDGKTIILLNHKRIWQLSNYEAPHFFSGKIKKISFKHNSQKEGVCFKNDSTLVITDERHGSEGGNIYGFNLNNSN